VDELQVMDTAVEVVVSRVRAPKVRNHVRLLGLSRTAVAYPNDVAHFLGIPPDSSWSIYNFGCSSGTSMTGVQVLGFTEKQYTTRMQVMSQAVCNTVQAHLQPSERACVLVPTRKQVILTAQILKERVLNFRNPKIWLQSQEKQDKKDICIQDLTVKEMLEHGIGLLHPGMSKADCDVVEDLASSQKIRVSYFYTIL
jgi:replicative superfamily II helicase